MIGNLGAWVQARVLADLKADHAHIRGVIEWNQGKGVQRSEMMETTLGVLFELPCASYNIEDFCFDFNQCRDVLSQLSDIARGQAERREFHA